MVHFLMCLIFFDPEFEIKKKIWHPKSIGPIKLCLGHLVSDNCCLFPEGNSELKLTDDYGICFLKKGKNHKKRKLGPGVRLG